MNEKESKEPQQVGDEVGDAGEAIITPSFPNPRPAEQRLLGESSVGTIVGKGSLGEAQEERVRQQLVAEGYQQPYGTTDIEIRRNLGILGKCADFVGYHARLDRWLIAESKGNDMQSALEQIESTLHALIATEVSAAKHIELRIYTNQQQYERLTKDPRGASGYHVKGSFLGYRPERTFIYSIINGNRVQVHRES